MKLTVLPVAQIVRLRSAGVAQANFDLGHALEDSERN